MRHKNAGEVANKPDDEMYRARRQRTKGYLISADIVPYVIGLAIALYGNHVYFR